MVELKNLSSLNPESLCSLLSAVHDLESAVRARRHPLQLEVLNHMVEVNIELFK